MKKWVLSLYLLFCLSNSVSAQSIEVGFSPEGSAAVLVEKAIDSAQKKIRLAAYSFTSASVTKALLKAAHRGVEVGVIVDYKNNFLDDKTGKAQAALSALSSAGIVVRVIESYPIHHDKYMVIDGLHVETGSYNYSESAAKRNSENVIVVWNSPSIAAQFLKQWESRFKQSIPLEKRY